MPRPRVAYSAARQLIDSGQASAEDIAANFDLVMDGPSVADQARASMERRKQGGDLPPGYTDEMMRDHQTPQQARYGMLAPFVTENAPGFIRGAKEMLPSLHDAGTLARAGAEMLAPASTPLIEKATGHDLTRELPASTQVLKNIGAAQVNEGKRAVSEMRNAINAPSVPEYLKRSVEAAGHGAAALLPVIGPAAASAGEDIKRGDIAYGLGKGAALVGSVAAPSIAADVVGKVAPGIGRAAQASAEGAINAGVREPAGFIKPGPIQPADTFRANVERIAAANPDAPALTEIIKGQGPKVVKGAVIATIGKLTPVPGLKLLIEYLGGERAGLAGWKALRDLPKTAAFKAANVTAKVAFAKALTSGDIETAVNVGGRIVGGAGIVTESGPPSGATPTDGPLVTRAAGPGRVEEWPPAGQQDENAQLFMKGQGGFPLSPSRLLPERFANARKVAYASAINGQAVPPEYEEPNFHTEAIYGLSGDTSTKRWPYDRNLTWRDNDLILTAQTPEEHSRLAANQITLGREAENMPERWSHELGHAIWEKDLTDKERASFEQLRQGAIGQIRSDLTATGTRPGDPRFNEAAKAVLQRYPLALRFYMGSHQDPRLATEETFSELNGQFMANPSAFKRTYPDWYGWFHQLHGREYIQPRTR